MTTFYLAVMIFSALVLLAALSSALAYRFGAPLLLLFSSSACWRAQTVLASNSIMML
nr:hypothetical protein [Marinicella sp. W31]MDC2877948.1 hypothetical protein [Marinicella sp. W31]